jgi:hypothetical protein
MKWRIIMKLNVLLTNGNALNFEGTEKELINISLELVNKWGNLIANNRDGSEPKLHDANTRLSEWTAQTAKQFLNKLFGDQQKLVGYLIAKGGTATSSEIEEQLGLAKQKLAGVLSSITRNAQKATSDRAARLVAWRGTADGAYQYYIEPEALQYMSASATPQEDSPTP